MPVKSLNLFTPAALAAIGLLASCSDGSPPAATAPGAEEPALAAVSATAIPTNTWVRRANLLRIERFGLVSATVPNAAGQSILYVIGGSIRGDQAPGPTDSTLRIVQAYNAATDSWTNRASLPIGLYRPNSAAVIDGRIYVSGGRLRGDKHYVASLYVYDPATNAWTRKSNMPDVTWGGISGGIGGQLYVLTCPGEELCSSEHRQELYRYTPATDQWSLVSVTPVALGNPMGGTIGGKLYAVGSRAGTLLVYDPATNGWTTRASLPGGGRVSAANLTFNGRLYLIGGFAYNPDLSIRRVRTVSVYDPATNAWSQRASLPRDWSDVTASRVVVGGQARIDVVGGLRPGNNLQLAP
jgi:N-acetylneuraminic acid mutarotase